MQIDLFGSTEATAVHEAAPPVLTPHGAWVPPETIIFNAALKRGSLVNAIAILNGLKVNAVRAVLLASGFSLGDANNRAGMIAFVQSDIVAAARQKLTGAELHSFRSQAQKANGLVQSKNTLFNEPSRESETRENQDHGSSSQSTGLHTGPSPESRANGLDGSDHRQSVDDGLANSGASLDDGGHLSDQFASADRAGEGRTVGSDRHEPPVPSGNLGPARGPAGATSHRVNAGPATGDAVDYVASEGDRIGQGGLAQKFRDNVRALQLVRQLKSENRHAAGDELRTLARYVG